MSPYARLQSVVQFVGDPAPLVTSWNWFIYDHLTSNLDLLFLCNCSLLLYSSWWLPFSCIIHCLTPPQSPPNSQRGSHLLHTNFCPISLQVTLIFHLIISTWLTLLRSPNIILHILEINDLEQIWICFNSLHLRSHYSKKEKMSVGLSSFPARFWLWPPHSPSL